VTFSGAGEKLTIAYANYHQDSKNLKLVKIVHFAGFIEKRKEHFLH